MLRVNSFALFRTLEEKRTDGPPDAPRPEVASFVRVGLRGQERRYTVYFISWSQSVQHLYERI